MDTSLTGMILGFDALASYAKIKMLVLLDTSLTGIIRLALLDAL